MEKLTVKEFTGIADDELSKRFYAAQSIIFSDATYAVRKKAGRLRSRINIEQMRRRREAIFAASAATTALGPAIFQGRELGSVERLTFYAGYHSTHPCKQQN